VPSLALLHVSAIKSHHQANTWLTYIHHWTAVLIKLDTIILWHEWRNRRLGVAWTLWTREVTSHTPSPSTSTQRSVNTPSPAVT
jgi:hypothetical protein